ncbi:hypothetical protein BH11MYX1_BH11MYX1_48250 [soil metagenome]
MRKYLIALAVTVSIAIAAMGFIAWESVDRQKVDHIEVISAAREEAKQLYPMCMDSPAAVKNGVMTGTAHFEELFATDAKLVRKTLVDVVMPMIESRQLACTNTLADFGEVRKIATAKDAYVDGAQPKVEAVISRFKTTRLAADQLRDAIDRSAPQAELVTKLTALRASTN